ncbi:vanadium-dependent haloperoxidase [Streptomyces sp. NPDC052236]|uniref:vanadium-dependent haloperoxidase n=1 Tax=Streptomyces sp. NPDC052236 TaxID=3365686 RepID=UPI0037D871CF
MTTSRHSPVSGSSPRRRSLLVGGASTAALVTLGHTGTAAAGQPTRPAAEPAADIDFDLDNGNFIRDLITTNAGGALPAENGIGPMDASVYIWITHLFQMSWFDALAPYHPTAVGVYSRIGRRPSSESATNRNKNIAALHAGYQVAKAVYEERALVMRQAMTLIGLDPDDESKDPTTPVGIGNIAGKAIVKARLRDGMNHLGDEGRTYNGQPYDDYTGYKPVNTAYKLVNPSRWQPAMGPHARRVGGGRGDKGIFIIQRFVTPYFGLVKAHTYRDPSQFKLAPPNHLDHTNPSRYKRSVDEILKASAALTDEQKVKAEFFDNKWVGITLAPRAAALSHDLDLDGWCHLFMVTSLARFDDLIAAWHQKRKYEAPRPYSAVRHVYGNSKVTAWGGPGKGTVNDIPADEWASFIPVGDHPDYPSGSTTLCAAEAQAARRFLGDDVLDWTYPVAAGSTLTEPGLVPAKDIELHYATWADFEKDCAMSRVWAGVHFKTTVERSLEWGAQFGDRAHEFVQRHINGDVQN